MQMVSLISSGGAIHVEGNCWQSICILKLCLIARLDLSAEEAVYYYCEIYPEVLISLFDLWSIDLFTPTQYQWGTHAARNSFN